jgi:hypothetical protein
MVILGFYDLLLHTRIVIHVVIRWLHPDDPLRAPFGSDGPPAPRTHARACAEAKESDKAAHHPWKRENHPRKKTGINHWSPLSVLNNFDMIWDFCPDMMHIIKTFFDRLMLGVYSGKRKPSKFKAPEPEDPGTGSSRADKKKYKEKLKIYEERASEYKKAREAFDACLFNKEDQIIVDERVKNLVGFPNWIKISLVTTQYWLFEQYLHKIC